MAQPFLVLVSLDRQKKAHSSLHATFFFFLKKVYATFCRPGQRMLRGTMMIHDMIFLGDFFL
jgi:hypothetical protein